MIREQEGIEALGFDQWSQDDIDPADLDRFYIARVLAVHKDSDIIHNGQKEVYVELIGKMLCSAASPIDLPAVGNWVLVKHPC